jgi:hypothetical protein
VSIRTAKQWVQGFLLGAFFGYWILWIAWLLIAIPETLIVAFGLVALVCVIGWAFNE